MVAGLTSLAGMAAAGLPVMNGSMATMRPPSSASRYAEWPMYVNLGMSPFPPARVPTLPSSPTPHGPADRGGAPPPRGAASAPARAGARRRWLVRANRGAGRGGLTHGALQRAPVRNGLP